MLSRVHLTILAWVVFLSQAAPVLAPPIRRAAPPEKWPDWLKEAYARPSAEAAGEADAVILHQETIVEPLAAGGVRYQHRLAVRLLKPSAVPKYDSWRVYYEKGAPRPELKAWTIGPDGKAVVPDPEVDFADLAAETPGVLFDNNRFRGVEAPVALPGSVVAYEDERILLFDRGAAQHLFGEVGQPVLFSRFVLQVPPGWTMAAVPLEVEGLEVQQDARTLTCTKRDLPAYTLEEHSPPFAAQAPRVWGRWFSADGSRGFRDWESMGKFVDALVAPVISQDQGVRALAQKLKEGRGGNLLDQLRAAFDFAARQVRYVSVDLGITGWVPHPPDEVLKQLYGDCKDKSTLLQAIARTWGLRSFPVHVRTSSQGPLAESVPSMAQFDHEIAALVLPDGVGEDLWAAMPVDGVGRVLFLDATARHSAAWELPREVQGTTALLGLPGGARLIRLPVQPPQASAARRHLTAAIDENARIAAGSIVETWSGAWGAAQRSFLGGRTPEERRKATLDFLNRVFQGASLESYAVEGLETVDTPVVERTGFTLGNLGKRVQDMLIVEPGRLAGLLGPRSIPASPRRQPLALEAPEQEIVEVAVRLPAGWVPEKLPAPESLSTPTLIVKAEWTVSEGALHYRREGSLLAAFVSPERFAAFRDDLLRLRRWDAKGIVFLKGPAKSP